MTFQLKRVSQRPTFPVSVGEQSIEGQHRTDYVALNGCVALKSGAEKSRSKVAL